MDDVLLLILEQAKLVYSHSSFMFSVKQVKDPSKEGKPLVWQVSLFKDNKDMNGPFVFVSGESETSIADAVVNLKRSFISFIESARLTELEKLTTANKAITESCARFNKALDALQAM